MPILSKRLMNSVRKEARDLGVRPPRFLDLAGRCVTGADPFSELSNSRRRRSYALQESINLGKPYIYSVAPGIMTWVLGLEDQRMILGSLVGSEVMVSDGVDVTGDTLVYLVRNGMTPDAAKAVVAKLNVWPLASVEEIATQMQVAFYTLSGWCPALMQERQQQIRQQKQINDALAEVRDRGGGALYAFEKERILLSNIRAGDRNASRRILNEMLATIYMTAPKLVVLRARVIELLSCLTRAAIEDNPLMEPLIERNHTWTEQLIHSESFEDLSACLMRALDDFIDGIYLHGVNRSNAHVHRALDYVGREYARPISLRDVAVHVGLSSCRLAHLVRDYTGRTVIQIIHHVRIQHAQELLEQSSMSCAEIAYTVGFGDQSYFTHLFKRQFGKTPLRYRKQR